MMVRAHGQQMLAALFGREFTPATSMAADVRYFSAQKNFGAQKNSESSVNLCVNLPKIRASMPLALAA
jgi:hypothetical protein